MEWTQDQRFSQRGKAGTKGLREPGIKGLVSGPLSSQCKTAVILSDAWPFWGQAESKDPYFEVPDPESRLWGLTLILVA
jgi:hypothetical protein